MADIRTVKLDIKDFDETDTIELRKVTKSRMANFSKSLINPGDVVKITLLKEKTNTKNEK